MERLSKPERAGLFIFAIAAAVLVAVAALIRDGDCTSTPLSAEEQSRMELFKSQVEAAKADSAATEKKKGNGRKAVNVPMRNPFNDIIERDR